MAARQRIPDLLRSFVRNTYLWRNLLAIVAIASMMLPWVYLDGLESSLSGAELIAYTFATGTERWEMVKQSVPGAFSLFFVPVIVAGLCIYAFVQIWRDRHPVKTCAVAALLPLLIVLFSGSVTSSEHLIAGRLVFPQAGIVLMFLCQGGLAVYSLAKGP